MKPIELKELLLDGIKAEPTFLTIDQKKLKEEQQLIERINKYQPEQGWLVFQSNVVFFTSTEEFEKNIKEGSGVLLNSEMCKGKNESLHIVEDGQGGWKATYYTEDPENGEDEVMADDFEMLGNKRKNAEKYPEIRYRRFMKYTEGIGYHPYAARFNGFENEGDLA